MADESDVQAAIVDLVNAALYPDGSSGPSKAGPPVKIFPGWPVSAKLEEDLANGLTSVSVFSVPGSSSDVGLQPFLTQDFVVTPAVHGLTATVSGSDITLAGAPSPEEYATAIIERRGFSYLAQADDDVNAMAAGLAAQIAAAYPGTAASGGTIHVATTAPIVLRLGSPTTLCERIHRQRQQFRITVWAPTPEDRSAVARLVDVALKRNLTPVMPDGTRALMTYQGTVVSDDYEATEVFRRDLIFFVTYDTLDTYTAYEITSVDISFELSTQPDASTSPDP